MASINRITGLATGMDTEAIIEQLMNANKAPLTELEKEQTTIEWQREALLDINSKFLAFRNESLDMKLQGTYKSYTATSSDSSIVSASANTDAKEGAYKVSVRQLATQATISGNTLPQTIYGENPIDLTATDFTGKEFNVTYNGETKTIKFEDGEGEYNKTRSLRDALQAKLDEAFGLNQIQVSVQGSKTSAMVSFTSSTTLNLPVTLTSSSDDENKDFLKTAGILEGTSTEFDKTQTLGSLLTDTSFTDGKVDITVNGRTFTFSKDDTINSVFATINNDTEADVNIRFSNTQKRVIVNRDSYGAGRELDVGGCDEFWEKLGINMNDEEFVANNKVYGKNAIFDVAAPDGESAKEVEIASNNFVYDGVSMTFSETSKIIGEDADGKPIYETTTIDVSKNVDEIYDKIKSFVDSYNEMLGTLNKYYKEEKSGYDPLTDEERESLSEKQEEQWEEKAKQGILRRDTTLQSAISSMRNAVTSIVDNSSISSLFQIGISTVTYDAKNTQNNGKLTIDEEKLKQAIKEDIDGVTNLFANTASMIQGNKITNKNLALTGKDFTVTYGGNTKTITFDKDFDLNTADGRTAFEDYLKEKFENNFGTGCVSVTFSGDKLLINSLKNVDMKLSAGTNDALSMMNIKDGAKYSTSEKGFATKIYDICTTAMNGIIDKAGSNSNIVDSSTLGQALKRKKEAIATLEDRLEKLEERYYNQFAAMEEMINQMNSQSNSLTNMLSGN